MTHEAPEASNSPVHYSKQPNVLKSIKKKLLENKQSLLFAAISVAFTLWFCRFIFSPSSDVLGVSYTTGNTDSYAAFAGIIKEVAILHSGHIPAGVYWMPDFYGGSVATFFHISSIPDLTYTPFLILTYLSNDVSLSFKVIMVIALIIAQVCSYKLGKHYFKSTSIAWVLSIAYTFSVAFASKMNAGQPQFVMAGALMPGVFLVFERMLASPNRNNMAYASVALILLFLSDIQTTVFALFYIGLRVAYYLFTDQGKNQKTAIIKRLVEVITIFGFSMAPFLISFDWIQNFGELKVGFTLTPDYTFPFSSFLLRGQGTDISPATGTAAFSAYVGIALFVLAFIPMILPRLHANVSTRNNYLFHVLSFILFSLIVMGPLSFFLAIFSVRVPNRGLLSVTLSLAICSCYGLLYLYNYLRPKLQRSHWSILRNRTFHTIIVIGLVSILFFDAASEVYPLTAPGPKLTGGQLFIQEQQGDFRILQYPTLWAVSDYESMLMNHQIIGESIIALRSSPPNSELFDKLANLFQTIPSSDVDAENLTMLATICGAKYVLIETNSSLAPQASDYTKFFGGNASKYFSVVYSDQESIVYENLFFKGYAFAVEDQGQAPDLTNLTFNEFSKNILSDAQISVTNGFNSIKISANISKPAYLVISQAYYPYWVVRGNGTNSAQFTEVLNVTGIHLDKGTYELTASFVVADQTNLLFLSSFICFSLISLIIYADSKSKQTLLKGSLTALFVCGIDLTTMSLLDPNIIAVASNWPGFGIYHKVILVIGGFAVLIAIFGFVKGKAREMIGLLWSKLRLSVSQVMKNRVLQRIKGFITLKGASLNLGRTRSLGQLNNWIKLLVGLILMSVVLGNLTLAIPGTITWLNEDVFVIIVLAFLMFTIQVTYLDRSKSDLSVALLASEDQETG